MFLLKTHIVLVSLPSALTAAVTICFHRDTGLEMPTDFWGSVPFHFRLSKVTIKFFNVHSTVTSTEPPSQLSDLRVVTFRKSLEIRTKSRLSVVVGSSKRHRRCPCQERTDETGRVQLQADCIATWPIRLVTDNSL